MTTAKISNITHIGEDLHGYYIYGETEFGERWCASFETLLDDETWSERGGAQGHVKLKKLTWREEDDTSKAP